MAVKRTRPSRPPAARRRKAATADVVTRPRRPARVPARWKEHYRRLTRLREQLLHWRTDLAKDAADEQPAFSMHMADAGTDSFDRDFALSRLSSEQDAVYEVEEAINRIRAGTYGVCELTGKRIEARRLRAVPWTRFCAAAERQLEREGAAAHTRLAPREHLIRGTESGRRSEAGAEDEEPEEK